MSVCLSVCLSATICLQNGIIPTHAIIWDSISHLDVEGKM